MFSWQKLFLISVFFLALQSAYSQTNPNEYQEEKPILLRQEMSFGVTLHTSGWGFEVKRGRNITGFKKLMFEAQFVSMKHPKERRVINPFFENSKSYFFGKLNTFNIIRASAGARKTLYSKADRTGVEVRFIYMGGLSLGITKPVYLEILTEEPPNSGLYDVVTEKYDPNNQNHNPENIYGRASFTQGLDEIKFHPGGYAKVGFNFEYAPFHEDIKAIEVGASLDAYPRRIPIMAVQVDSDNNGILDGKDKWDPYHKPNKQFFLTFYFTLIYGRKW